MKATLAILALVFAHPRFTKTRISTGLLWMGLPLLMLLVLPVMAILKETTPGHLSELLQGGNILLAVRTSFVTSGFSLALIILLGTPLAAYLARNPPMGGILQGLITLPIILPPAVAGLGLLLAFGRQSFLGATLNSLFGAQVSFTPIAVILAQVFVGAPYFIRTVTVGLAGIDEGIKEAARLDGAGSWKLFWHVTMPLCWGSFLSGGALAWARAMGEFGATLLFAGNLPGKTQTMPLFLYVSMENNFGEALAVSAIMLVCVACVMFIASQVLNLRISKPR